jgi:hypothetical protein
MPKYRWSGVMRGRKTSGELTAHSEGELRAKLGKLVDIQSVEMLSSDVDESWHHEAPDVDRGGVPSPAFGARAAVLGFALLCLGVAGGIAWFAGREGDLVPLVIAAGFAVLGLLSLVAFAAGFLPGVRQRLAGFVSARARR